MKRSILIVLFIAMSTIARADRWYAVKVKNGKAVAVAIRESPKKHVLGNEEYPIDALLPRNVACKYWKKSGNTWVEMNQAEKDAVDDSIKSVKAQMQDVDPVVKALALVVADELGISPADLRAKIKAKLQ